jgi:hypothetical protein
MTTQTTTTTDLSTLSIAGLAQVIKKDWKKVYFGAVPYLNAMCLLNHISDTYGLDDCKDIVLYFLSNAQSWRGETAKAVKAELKKRCGSIK